MKSGQRFWRKHWHKEKLFYLDKNGDPSISFYTILDARI